MHYNYSQNTMHGHVGFKTYNLIIVKIMNNNIHFGLCSVYYTCYNINMSKFVFTYTYNNANVVIIVMIRNGGSGCYTYLYPSTILGLSS